MNQYKKRITIERSLVKKINSWFPKNKLHGLSWGAINKWAEDCQISTSQTGYQKLIEISKMLISLANRSQEVVDPKVVSDIEFIEKQINEFKLELFK
jgi:hypothetical protein